MKKFINIFLVIIFLAGGYWLTRPVFYVKGENQVIAAVNAYDQLPLKIEFIHSVQKTPVEEYLYLQENLHTLVLDKTIYHSFGVGLPFLESDGEWRQEGNDFILSGMQREFHNLSLRVGVGTKLTLTIDNIVYPVYEQFPPGTKIDFYTAPRFYILKNFLK